jgi:hypothetical protein
LNQHNRKKNVKIKVRLYFFGLQKKIICIYFLTESPERKKKERIKIHRHKMNFDEISTYRNYYPFFR